MVKEMRTKEFVENKKRIVEDYCEALSILDVLDIEVEKNHESQSDECNCFVSIG